MFVIDKIILLGAVLILLGVISSKASARLGLPMLVLFLIVGMLAGERGIARIEFDDANTAHAIGTLALAMILFDGGLQTPMGTIKMVWKPAALLATAGVLVTAIITGLAAAWILDVPLLVGLLMGAIVGSTDAAAVFTQMRNAGIHIRLRLKSLLEVESASNDPMAIFLTIGLLEVLINDVPFGFGLLQLFAEQMGIGAIAGIGVGWAAVSIINRIHLQASGLYPVLVTSCGLLAFGLAANMGGSGFLAIFVAGVMIGNSKIVFQRGVFMFHDGLAWMSQITMFVILGLLVDPKALAEVWLEGLLISIALIFVARPLSVIPILKPFGFGKNEITLVSWVGLRGSVPIVLAIFPLIFGLPQAPLIFNVVFFVVLISATLQGSTLSLVAKRLGLAEAPPPKPAATLEITTLQDVNADIVEYTLTPDSRAVGRSLSRLALPEGTVVAMITRGEEVIPPRGSTILRANDHLFAVIRSEGRPFVDLTFSQNVKAENISFPNTELRLKGATKVGEIHLSYGILIQMPEDMNLETIIQQQTENKPSVGHVIKIREISLKVCEMIGARISTVGLVVNQDQSYPASAL